MLPAISETGTRVCRTCSRELKIEKFWKYLRDGETRYQGSCGECVIERRRGEVGPVKAEYKPRSAYPETSPADRRNARLLRHYGITSAEYAEMSVRQGGVCANCTRPAQEGHRLHVDHDHATGRVRALLCQNCNVRLGWFEKYGVEDLTKYLEMHA